MALIGRLGAHHNLRRKPPQTKVAPPGPLLIIPAVVRRVHVSSVQPGDISLDAVQARHARDVLRLQSGAAVEVFDDAGTVATGELVIAGREVLVRVDASGVTRDVGDALAWTIAAAVPKGERADWMVEKLSELGTAAFVPLAAARSVVLPEGRNKRERWTRIATEAAKQSRRAGVMRVGELTTLDAMLKELADTADAAGWHFSTADGAKPAGEAADALPPGIRSIVAFIGPEGGWTDDELSRFAAAGLTPVRLTATVLRVETAAVAAAAIIGTVIAPRVDR
jgi:16S rRNA (uracil1498-N3)-methyltransferase